MNKPARAQSPAAFAEQYIVESIWAGRFAPGTILPAERELSELIGVTRTTLREVLQRLARDGWLTIQHGKPTQVNDIWQTAGLNILDTLTRLDDKNSLELVDQLLDARTSLSSVYVRAAVRRNRDAVLALLAEAPQVEDEADAFTRWDWRFHHTLTRLSMNPVFTLVLNGFRSIYYRVGRQYFLRQDARGAAREFYRQLEAVIRSGDLNGLNSVIWQYGRESGRIWQELRAQLSSVHDLPQLGN